MTTRELCALAVLAYGLTVIVAAFDLRDWLRSVWSGEVWYG